MNSIITQGLGQNKCGLVTHGLGGTIIEIAKKFVQRSIKLGYSTKKKFDDIFVWVQLIGVNYHKMSGPKGTIESAISENAATVSVDKLNHNNYRRIFQVKVSRIK